MKRMLIIAMLCITSLAYSQSGTDISQFVRQTQIWKKDEKDMKLAWWVPTDYWRIALEGNKDVPESVVDQLENVFADYVLIYAANVNVSTLGTFSGTDEETLGKSIVLIDHEGKKHYPLKREDVSSEALQVEANMKPMFAQAMGQMGKSMHLFFFKVKDANQKNMIVAKNEGGFTVQHSGAEFVWSLPLPILMPAKHCPTDQAVMQGDWKFCPYHGVKLN